MNQRPSFRPRASVRTYTWIDRADGSRTPGIAVMHTGKVLAHMNPDEARALADKLHDLADQLDADA